MRIRELIIRLGVEADLKSIDIAEAKMQDLKSAAGDLGNMLKRTMFVVGALGAAFAANALEVGTFAEEVERSSDAFGMSVEKYQEMRFAFQSLGASSDDLADALSTMAERVVKAGDGSKEARKEFEKMGLNWRELRHQKPHEILEKWMEAASATKDINASVASGVALLGDDLGRRIAKGLRTAGNGFNDYAKIMRDLGPFSKKQLDDGVKFQMQMRVLGATFTKIRRQVGFALMPAFSKLADYVLAKVANRAGDIKDALEKMGIIGGRVVDDLIYAFEWLDNEVQTRFGSWPALFGKIGQALATAFMLLLGARVAVVIRAITLAFSALSIPVAIAAAKVALIAAAVAMTILVFESLYVWVKNGNSVMGDLFDMMKDKGGFVGWLAEQLFDLKEEFASFLEEAEAFWQKHGPEIKKTLKSIAGLMAGAMLTAVVEFTRVAVGGFRLLIYTIDTLLESFGSLQAVLRMVMPTLAFAIDAKATYDGERPVTGSPSAPAMLGSNNLQMARAGNGKGNTNNTSTNTFDAQFGDIIVNAGDGQSTPETGRVIKQNVTDALAGWKNSWGNALSAGEV
jgi:hypothetical protein